MQENRRVPKPKETQAARKARLIAEETEIERKLDEAFGPSMSHKESMAFLRSLPRKRAKQSRR